ncbi:glycosyltransferase family 2 protein [Mucilaginibacter sp. KACC 22773]|uniref:glycosyltransferase family 2 protein n=1 Tax=Mucilaginibacter sp. KACC 22773 TaxID=3025671 RepID=UPI002364FE55|nr:glycosyltransferase family 2 protein [Mucilaginibacter sp. KACC 22773]WDF79149.1 glycosyltransferase family 2 protein [Mucilaginibacter sp. KACC 22773]
MAKIAAITTSHNEDYQFDNWLTHYEAYKDEISYHIIVENNSNETYRQKIREHFTDATILWQDEDLGVARGFNEGIKYVIEHTDADVILFMMQDMYIPKGGVTILKDLLLSSEKNGVVAAVNLYENRSNIIREHGGNINKKDFTVDKFYKDKVLDNSIPQDLQVDFVCGGNYMMKTNIFKETGLYDERIFMYGDESDLFIRVKKAGYDIISTTRTQCWHEHIYLTAAARLPSNHAVFYTARNYFYLIKKHGNGLNFTYGLLKSIKVAAKNLAKFYLHEKNFTKIRLMMKGYFTGIFLLHLNKD